jgi:hypothetical protein
MYHRQVLNNGYLLLRVRIGFNADPDPAIWDPVPDPGLDSQIVKKLTPGICSSFLIENSTRPPYRTSKL